MSTFRCRINDTLAILDNRTTCEKLDDDYAVSLGSWEPLFLFYSRNFHVTLSSIICVVGLLGNLLLMTVLLRPNMLSQGGHGAVHVILASIALTDLITDLTNLIYVMGRSIQSRNDPCDWSGVFFYGYTWNVFVLIHADVSVFLHALSLYLTVVLAYMRVRVIYSGGTNVGVRSGSRNTSMTQNEIRSGIWHIIGATVIVAIFCIPNFLRNTIKKVAVNSCKSRSPQLPRDDNFLTSRFLDHHKQTDRQMSSSFDRYEIVSPDFWNTFYENFTFWINGITSKIVPCFLLTLFMALLVQVIVTSRRNRRKLMAVRHRQYLSPTPLPPGSSSSSTTGADRTTVILLSIVFIFWLTELPQGVLLIGSSFDEAIFYAYRLMGDVLDLLSLVNSTVNFMLYCSMSAKFRQEIWRMMLQWFSRRHGTTVNGQTPGNVKKRNSRRHIRNFNGSSINYTSGRSENETSDERAYVELPVIPERCTEED